MAAPPPAVLGEVPAKYFAGGAHLADGELAQLLNQAARADAVRIDHKPTITAGRAEPQPGQGPTIVVLGTVMGLAFAGASDAAYRVFKIDTNFTGDFAAFHLHWTKNGDGDEQGNTVRWRLRYTVFDGGNDNVIVPATTLTVDDAYDAADTTQRTVYRSPDVNAVGFVAGYYVGLCVDVDPAGTTLVSAPVLVSADLRLSVLANQ